MMKKLLCVVITLIMTMLLTITPVTVAQEKKEQTAEKPQEAGKTEEQDALTKQVLEFLNTATPEQLQEISGIGEKLSQVIVDGRKYESLEDILAVKGIGEKKLESIIEFIKAGPPEKSEEKAEGSTKESKDDEKQDDKKDEKKADEKSKK